MVKREFKENNRIRGFGLTLNELCGSKKVGIN